MNEKLIELAVANLPGMIASLKGLFVRDNPGEPEPTDEEVAAAYYQAIASTLGVDAEWLKNHPVQ